MSLVLIISIMSNRSKLHYSDFIYGLSCREGWQSRIAPHPYWKHLRWMLIYSILTRSEKTIDYRLGAIGRHRVRLILIQESKSVQVHVSIVWWSFALIDAGADVIILDEKQQILAYCCSLPTSLLRSDVIKTATLKNRSVIQNEMNRCGIHIWTISQSLWTE